MLSGLSNVSLFGDLLRVLSGASPESIGSLGSAGSLGSRLGPVVERLPSLGPARVDISSSPIQRVELPELVRQAIGELERAHNTSALIGVGVTSFNTLNSSIKRVHQGQ